MVASGPPSKPLIEELTPAHVQPLDSFFAPRSVAVVGATETAGSVGRTLLWNLISNPFGGTVYPVNPRRSSILGIRAYPSIAGLPEPLELAVIATPAATVPDVVAECAAAGVKAAIVISAGFKECGAAGEELERRILAEADRTKMRIIGPNCLGVMSPPSGFNATFAGGFARPGTVGFISQSGALCTAVLDWSLRELVGFSAFVSLGSMLDVGWGDLIQHLGNDPRTRSIVIYMESIGDARAFLSAAREVALTKPIIVIKAGRSEAAARAAASHTGALAGSDEVLDAAFRRSGVLRVVNIADLFYMAEVLAKQPRPRGPRLMILTNAGGPGVLATDALVASGGELAVLEPKTVDALSEFLPPHWSRANPIDILGDASPERYARAVEIASRDAGADGLLVVLTPQAMTDPTRTADELRAHARLDGKPMLASWMGGADVAAGEAILNQANIPTFPYPDTAARAFTYMWRYTYNLRGLYETPHYPTDNSRNGPDRAEAARVIDGARESGRTVLSELESKELLAAYGLPTVTTRLARTAPQAVRLAETIGYPVACKLHSHRITHKSDVGGVQLDLADAAAVRAAFEAIKQGAKKAGGDGDFLGMTVQPMISRDGYELILGSSIDPQFGPVLLFGAGGLLVEVFRDRALGLPPLNTTLARRMMEQTKIYLALQGVRGRKPVDLLALEQILVRFSQLVVEQPWIREIDVNPLLASADRLIALDARVILHDPATLEADLPKLAIRPYPIQYSAPFKTKSGTTVMIRPIRPEDEPMMIRFHETLSERSVHLRYFHAMRLDQRVAHERLTRMCFIDYDREMALVAERTQPRTGERSILGVGRIIKLHGTNDAEFAVVVSDQHHGTGIGSELMRRLVDVARAERLDRLTGDILPDNQGMKRICQELGFTSRYSVDEGVVKADLEL